MEQEKLNATNISVCKSLKTKEEEKASR